MNIEERIKKLEKHFLASVPTATFAIIYDDGTVSQTSAPPGVTESLTIQVEYVEGDVQ